MAGLAVYVCLLTAVNFVVNGHEQRVFNRTKAIREQPRSSQAVVPEDECFALVPTLNPSTGTAKPFVGITPGGAERFTLNDDKTEYTLTTPPSTELPDYSCILTLKSNGIIRVDEFLPQTITDGTTIPGCAFVVDSTELNPVVVSTELIKSSDKDKFRATISITNSPTTGVRAQFTFEANGRTYSTGNRRAEYITLRYLSLVSA
jgi:hypothetical protein